MSIEFKLLDISTFADQVRVHNQVFTPVTESYWNKKHYLNPIANSLIFGAFINNELVGINCFQPYIYKYGGNDIRVLQSCESGVLKEYQGKGVWSKLMSYAYKHILEYNKYDVLIGFPNYRTSYGGFLKMGWTEELTMVNYVMVNNVKVFANTFICDNLFIRLLSQILNVQKAIISIRYLINKNKIFIKKCAPAELFWDINRNILQVTKDSIFLDWKLSYKNCSCINIIYNKQIVGSCIYGIIQHKGVPVIIINKISLKEGSSISKNNIIAAISRYISKKHRNAAYIRTWALPEDDSLNGILKSLLYKQMNHPNPFITKHINKDYSHLKWDISLLDLD